MRKEMKNAKISRLLSVLLVIVLTFSLLSGCRKNDPDPQETTAGTTAGTEFSEPTENTREDPTETTGTEETTGASTKPANTSAKTYTVTFKDYDGTVLKTQKVKKGNAATAPADPVRENFTFTGWDKAFDKVTSDLVVTATYTTGKALIYAESVTVNKGAGEVTVNVRVKNNPGIMGAVLKVSVDDKVFSFKEAKNVQYPGLTLTTPGSATTSSPYTLLLDAIELSEEDRKDDVLFTVTFKINDTSATGSYKVKLAYDSGAIFNENYKDINVMLDNGTITIK